MVVKSVDTTIKQLTEYFQIDESSIVIKTTKDMAQQGTFTDCTYWGEPKEFYIKTARLSFGGIDFEYVEPLNQNGGDPFSDWLLKHAQGIHHINIQMKARSLLDRSMKERSCASQREDAGQGIRVLRLAGHFRFHRRDW